MYRNIITQQASDSLPVSIGATYNPTWEMCRDAGWRIQVDPPELADGYERTVRGWVQCPADIDKAVLDFEDTLIQTRLDAEAAAASAAKMAALTPELVQMAAIFRMTMRRIFGDGAETNHALDLAAVAGYFEHRRMAGTITAQETADAMALNMYFEKLAAWTGDGTTWSFPWEIVP